mgnify:CR=1 FL=1
MRTGAEIYDFVAPNYQFMRESRAPYIAAINSHCIKILRGCKNWLDVGSGDGARVRDILGHVSLAEVVCIEPSRAMADLCAENVTNGKVLNRYLDTSFSSEYHERFDCVTALWNVMGHLQTGVQRKEFIDQARTTLKSGGTLFLDVNNRHNGKAYGFFRCLFRYLLDRICFRESRGDAVYSVTVNGKSEWCSGHIFSTEEVVQLFPSKQWRKVEIQYLDYQSGKKVASRFFGQIVIRAIAL